VSKAVSGMCCCPMILAIQHVSLIYSFIIFKFESVGRQNTLTIKTIVFLFIPLEARYGRKWSSLQQYLSNDEFYCCSFDVGKEHDIIVLLHANSLKEGYRKSKTLQNVHTHRRKHQSHSNLRNSIRK
jgi:hypothetical protein